MESKIIQNKVTQNKVSDPFKELDLCAVSKASVEIMLERFCKGKKIDFPFAQ